MPDFIHAPDFEILPAGKIFTDFMSQGGNPPGQIVVDSDGKHALLAGIASNGLDYKRRFLALDRGGSITAEDEIRIETARVKDVSAFICYELTDGDDGRGPYVELFFDMKLGCLALAVWGEWNQHERLIPLMKFAVGPVGDAIYKIGVKFDQNSVTVTVNGKPRTTIVPSMPMGLDTLRVRAVGLVTSTDPADAVGRTVRGTYTARVWRALWFRTVTVYQFWMALIREHKVYGPARG